MQERRGVITVQSQMTYAFSLEYFHAAGSCGLTLGWQPPDADFDFIPSSAYTRSASVFAPHPAVPSSALAMSMGSLGADDASSAHTCFIAADRSLWCSGNNNFGQLGVVDASIIALTPFKPIDFIVNAVALGGSHTCVTNISDALMCWGADGRGQIGDGLTTSVQPLPTTPLFPALSPPVARTVSFSLGL